MSAQVPLQTKEEDTYVAVNVYACAALIALNVAAMLRIMPSQQHTALTPTTMLSTAVRWDAAQQLQPTRHVGGKTSTLFAMTQLHE
jgi:uncharacterized membrane protein